MLGNDAVHQRAQHFQLVDVTGIHQHAVGERAGLVAAGLVGLVEQRTNLRVLGKHHLVEVGGQGFTTGFQQGHGGFDDGTNLAGQHNDSDIWVGSFCLY
ncbi:hypothetical protein D3C78_1538310 [compost metagenome]